MRVNIKYRKVLSIICLAKGHKYVPAYEQRCLKYKKGTKVRHIKNRFTCQRCGAKTKWMNQEQARKLIEEKASW